MKATEIRSLVFGRSTDPTEALLSPDELNADVLAKASTVDYTTLWLALAWFIFTDEKWGLMQFASNWDGPVLQKFLELLRDESDVEWDWHQLAEESDRAISQLGDSRPPGWMFSLEVSPLMTALAFRDARTDPSCLLTATAGAVNVLVLQGVIADSMVEFKRLYWLDDKRTTDETYRTRALDIRAVQKAKLIELLLDN